MQLYSNIKVWNKSYLFIILLCVYFFTIFIDIIALNQNVYWLSVAGKKYSLKRSTAGYLLTSSDSELIPTFRPSESQQKWLCIALHITEHNSP